MLRETSQTRQRQSDVRRFPPLLPSYAVPLEVWPDRAGKGWHSLSQNVVRRGESCTRWYVSIFPLLRLWELVTMLPKQEHRRCADIIGGAAMKEMVLHVPTYNANYYPTQVETGLIEEYGTPFVPVVIQEAAGIRVVLGTEDCNESRATDILIDRQPNGWVVFLHPFGGDPSGYVYLCDEGRTIFLKERTFGSEPEVQVLEAGENVPEFDAEPST